jgi:hypothetical protein
MLFLMNLMLHGVRSPRASVWGGVAMLVGLVIASLGSVASAETVAQAAPTATATPTTTACASAPQGIVVIIQSPNPGDVIMAGANVVIQGIAYDTASTTGSGIDRVGVYYGDRDAGGIFWGDAILGQASSGPLTNAGFSLRSPTIPVGSGGRTIFVYAHSAVSNKEAIASVPVFLGAAPTPVRGQVPTAVLPTPAPCTPTPTATPVSTSTPTPTPTTPPVVIVPAAPAPVAPAPAPPAPAAPAVPLAPAPAPAAPAAAAPAPAAVAPATATTAPRGGGIPIGVGFVLLGVGVVVVGGGFVARRRERRGSPPRS